MFGILSWPTTTIGCCIKNGCSSSRNKECEESMNLMKNLNTYQKVALAVAGAIILLIQLIKFSDEGIEGASWILSFAISALLFIPILSDVDSIVNSIKSGFIRADGVDEIKTQSTSNETGELFKVLGARAEKLHKFLADKGAVDTVLVGFAR